MANSIETESVMDIAEKIKKECHNFAQYASHKGTYATYQDATTVFIFLKLAELQSQINYLEQKNLT